MRVNALFFTSVRGLASFRARAWSRGARPNVQRLATTFSTMVSTTLMRIIRPSGM
jgi:hypothetical protein